MAVAVIVPGVTSNAYVAGASASTAQSTTVNTPAFGFYSTQGASAGNNLGIGVYSESHITGNMTDHTYGGGFWINYDSGTMTAGTHLTPMDNGIYQSGGTLTNVNVYFGGIFEGIVTSTPAVFSPFWVNTNNRAITSLFDGAAAPSVGYVGNTGTSANKIGDIPIASVNGTIFYVRVYDARG